MLIVKKFKNISWRADKDYLVARTKLEARKNLLRHTWSAQDRALDYYLRENYKTGLLQACLDIVANAQLSHDCSTENEVIVLLPDKRLDNLASLITYGDSRVGGSDIIKKIFK